MKCNRLAAAILGAAALLTASITVNAGHSWNNYHWARNTSSFNLGVIDSNTSNWDDELSLALSQWSQSSKLNMSITSSSDSSSTRAACSMVTGKVRSCNYSYGSNGWLGLASINLDSQGHITRGTSKLNDTYSSSFASQNQRRHVMCQELGHTLGLTHTSTNGSSQGTCMDYSTSASSTAPNSHDYSQLTSMYSHLDTYNSATAAAAAIAGASGNAREAPLSDEQERMAGPIPMGVRVSIGVFEELWAAPDGKGGTYIHHILLAPGFEHTELLDGS